MLRLSPNSTGGIIEYEWTTVSTEDIIRVKWLATQTVTFSHWEIVQTLFEAPI